MKIIHRVSFSPGDGMLETFSSLNLQLEDHSGKFVRLFIFEIDEQDPAWPTVRELISKYSLPDFPATEFTEDELEAASYLRIHTLARGYPLPERKFGYRAVTYDLSSHCDKCGIGLRQIAPFRIKDEPKWGKNHIFRLNWVLDSYFVPPQIWEDIFRPMGIGKIDVLDRKGQKVLQTVVQLDIQDSDSPLEIDGYPFEICSHCDRKRYRPIARGFLPSFKSDPGHPIFKTQEWFGSGAAADHFVVVTHEFYKIVQALKLKGFAWYPHASKSSCLGE